MPANLGSRINEQVVEEAAAWFLEFRDEASGVERRREFDEWIRRSPDHLAAYLDMGAIWNEAVTLDAPSREALAQSATEEPDNVVQWPQPLSTTAPPTKPITTTKWFRRAWPRWAAVLVLLIGAGVVFHWRGSTYETDRGEQRLIALSDGSTIELNARSEIRVRLTQDRRWIELVKGQALFTVAKDPARPFVVQSGEASIRALGTEFDVYLKPTGTVVTVVEGQVAVQRGMQPALDKPTEPSPANIVISAGQQLVVAQADPKKPVTANVANATAWTQNRLAFDGAKLSEVAEEFNRYNPRRLVIEDPDLNGLRISGIFSSTNPRGLIHFISDLPDVRVTETPAEIRVGKSPGN